MQILLKQIVKVDIHIVYLVNKVVLHIEHVQIMVQMLLHSHTSIVRIGYQVVLLMILILDVQKRHVIIQVSRLNLKMHILHQVK